MLLTACVFFLTICVKVIKKKFMFVIVCLLLFFFLVIVEVDKDVVGWQSFVQNGEIMLLISVIKLCAMCASVRML